MCLSFQTFTTFARCTGALSSCKVVARRRRRRLTTNGKKCKMSQYISLVTLPSVITSGLTQSLDMHLHTIIDCSPVLTVPSVQAGIHFSVDFRHANTLASLPIFFIFDSSVKTTFFRYVIVLFTISLAHCILFILLFLIIKGFSRAHLPLYSNDFSLTSSGGSFAYRFADTCTPFFAKALADDLRFSFTNIVRNLFSLSVVIEGLQE